MRQGYPGSSPPSILTDQLSSIRVGEPASATVALSACHLRTGCYSMWSTAQHPYAMVVEEVNAGKMTMS